MLNLDINKEKLYELCMRYHVDRMYLFGSALTPNYDQQSDIDFLVRFQPIELSLYFENYFNLKEQLKSLYGRDIDLLEEQALKNPILIQSINRTKQLVYG